MILRSKAKQSRIGQAGFTFLEVLISLALTAIVVGTVLVTFSRVATVQAERLHHLWLAEFALSVLEEYRVTFPEMPMSGATAGGWQWKISETVASPNPPGSLDGEMVYVSISATVWQAVRPDQTYLATTLIARRK